MRIGTRNSKDKVARYHEEPKNLNVVDTGVQASAIEMGVVNGIHHEVAGGYHLIAAVPNIPTNRMGLKGTCICDVNL